MNPAHIPLGNHHHAIIDAADFDWLMALAPWRRSNKAYAVHYTRDALGKRVVLYMHRLIMAHALGHTIPTQLQVDHINADRTDNRRANLRLATRSQNQAAKARQRNNTSKAKGICFHAGKFEVRLRYYRRRIYLGRYPTLPEAAAIYGFAHRLLWGVFTTEQDCPHLPTPSQQQSIHDRLHQQGIDL